MNAYLSRFITDDELTQLDLRHAELMAEINNPGIGDAVTDSIGQVQIGIEERMVATHASSIEGMRAKARTLRRLRANEFEASGGCFPPGADDIGRMTWSLLTDVLGEQAGTIDVPEMPLVQMLGLHEALCTVHDVVVALSCMRRFRDGAGNANEAGEFLNELWNLIGKASDEIARSAELMKIDDEASDEFAERAEILVRHELATAGVTDAARVAIELYGEPGKAA